MRATLLKLDPARGFQWVCATTPAELVAVNAVPPPANWIPMEVVPELAGLTITVRVAVPVPLALSALIVTELVPEAVGVPVIAPLLVLTDRPDGRPVAL